jgi:hypothetical protein
MQTLNDFRDQGFAILVHGSTVKGLATARSDIDFSMIGAQTFSELAARFAPELSDYGVPEIDYISTGIISENGRKISIHASLPAFRETYPTKDRPYAVEYRPQNNAKSGARRYFLPAIAKDKSIRLINFECSSETIGENSGTITEIPQTGKITIKGDTIFSGDKRLTMLAAEIIRLTIDGETDSSMSSDTAEELAILGLEEDKIRCPEVPLYDDWHAQRYVTEPIARSEKFIGAFIESDPEPTIRELYRQLAIYWPKVKPNKSR